MAALLRHYVRSEWVSQLIWSMGMALLAIFTVYAFTLFEQSDMMREVEKMLQNFPEGLRALYGDFAVMSTLAGWLQTSVFAGEFLLIYTIYAAVTVAGSIPREIERRTMEFLLSQPVSRAQIVLSRWLGLAAGLAALHAVHLLAVIAGVAMLGEQPVVSTYVTAELYSLLLFLAIGSIMLVLSLLVDDYGKALGITLATGLGMLFFHLGTGKAEGALKSVRDLLPFAQFDTAVVFRQADFPLTEVLTLAGIAAGGLALAVVLFQRKQIAA